MDRQAAWRGSRLTPSFVLVAFFAVASVALSGCSGREADAGAMPTKGSLVVVLATTPADTSLVVVDPVRRRAVRTVALRSLVTDIDADASTGLVVAAQTGGIGEKADDAVSVVDPRTGAVDYVTLPIRDPVSVECIDGRAYVLHSVVVEGDLVVSVVDIAKRKVVRSGAVPDGPGLWFAEAGELWAAQSDGPGSWHVIRIDTGSLETRDAAAADVLAEGFVRSRGSVLVLGSTRRPDGRPQAAVVSLASTGSPVADGRAVPVPALMYPARIACEVAGELVIGDWAAQAVEPHDLAVLDATSLRPLRSIKVDGVACALASLNGRLLVVERTAGRLLEMNTSTGAVVGSADLGRGELLASDLVVVE